MERQIVVTIGRCFGSNGRRIGEKLAKELGIGFYDRNLIERAAKESGIEWKTMGRADEKLIGKVVKSGESCVIVGRGADYVLRNRPEVLKVYIYAPYSIRVETVMERYNFSKDEAEKLVRYMY